VTLPFAGPLAPMLARLARELPRGPGWHYEPKWDGFRAMVWRDGDHIELWSRNQRPLSRYFPELVDATAAMAETQIVLDGEVMVPTGDGFDFVTLMGRLHPAASRVHRLAREQPACFVAFDILAQGATDLRAEPFSRRRDVLESVVSDGARISATPSTANPDVALEWLDAPAGTGIDGVVAKELSRPYESGGRSLVKVKHERTMECVVGGVRFDASGNEIVSLLLGLYDDAGTLRHIGVVAGMSRTRRVELVRDVLRHATDLPGHPWEHGFALEGGAMGRLRGSAGRWTPEMPLDWVPVRPDTVVEVAYEHPDAGLRLRHPARFRRWRNDRDPRSCTVHQLTDDHAPAQP
jgi:ATP-dependent DNA ligase